MNEVGSWSLRVQAEKLKECACGQSVSAVILDYTGCVQTASGNGERENSKFFQLRTLGITQPI